MNTNNLGDNSIQNKPTNKQKTKQSTLLQIDDPKITPYNFY